MYAAVADMDRFSQFLAFSKGKERRKPSLQESDDIKSCKVVLTFEAFDEPFKWNLDL